MFCNFVPTLLQAVGCVSVRVRTRAVCSFTAFMMSKEIST